MTDKVGLLRLILKDVLRVQVTEAEAEKVFERVSALLEKQAVEHRLYADGALCECENIESAIIRLMCKDCGLPLRPAGKA